MSNAPAIRPAVKALRKNDLLIKKFWFQSGTTNVVSLLRDQIYDFFIFQKLIFLLVINPDLS
jgi:hypothetical protein